MSRIGRLLALPLVAVSLGAPGVADAQIAPEQDAAAPSDARSAELGLLVEVLRDDEARARLIAELEGVAAAAPGDGADSASGAPPEPAGDAEEPISLGRALAQETQDLAKAAAEDVALFWRRVTNIPRAFSGLTGDELTVLYDAFANLALVIATTVAIFYALRRLAKRVYRRMSADAARAPFLQKGVIIAASNVVEITAVVVAWAGGYALATLVIGQYGEVGIRQSLYLNAFLIVELVKVALRALLAPRAPALRLLPAPDRGARIMNNGLSAAASVVGYGQLLVVPIINKNVSFFAGRGFSALILIAAILILTALILRYRADVAAWLLGRKKLNGGRGLLQTLARNWHIPALLYLAGLFLIVMTRPGGDVLPVLGASAQVFFAILFGVLAAQALKRSIAKGVALPERVNQRLPLLERRLNAFVPRTLFALRLVIIAAVGAFTLDTLGVLDAEGWLASQVGAQIAGSVFSVAVILIFAFLLWLAFSSYVEFRLNPDFGRAPTAREQTLLTLLRNAATVTLFVLTMMFVLSELGVDIAPLIASAGVLGLAIGFGAQKLVQDIITGVFIQLENAINVGEVITVGGVTGTVERLTVRSVSLRDLEGTFHIIPFSSIDMVSNYMREYAFHVCDMGVAYREKTDEAKAAMYDAFDELRANPAHGEAIIGELDWFGVNALGDSAVVLRARIRCRPGKQWAIGRAYNEVLKRVFDERGIEIPFPHQTIYFGETKDGATQPLRLAGPVGGRAVAAASS